MPIATRSRGRRWAVALASVALTVGLTSRGQEDATKERPGGEAGGRDDRRLVERWKREAAEYTIVARTEPESVLGLRAEPALHWTNPVREADDGLVFLWLVRGRPEAIACFYRARWEGRLTEAHEFHSLAPVALTATRAGRAVWSPSVAGVTPRPIPGAARPAATPAERLRQLRSLAREFRANVDVEKGSAELRQLSKPVFRFEAGPDRASDGALFAFVLTTDPEALLLIEERPDAGGTSWHYSFARMTNHSLAARHRDRVVWEVARDSDDNNPTKPYCVRWDVGPRP